MQFIPGRLYRAISAEDVIELEPPTSGLKLSLKPAHVKQLKQLQKLIEKVMGRRPDLVVVLDAVLEINQSLYLSQREPYLKRICDQIHNLQNPSTVKEN